MANSIVVYGPMASGKTLNADAICQVYSLKRVVELDERLQRKGDDWQLAQHDVLMLTNDRLLAEPTAQRLCIEAVAIADAHVRVGAAWRSPR
ncbi:hypothetical protein [Xanthomonas vasicola]|uniref:hypothetical protein n=1 Tax=Xanthomonas vasicola TaxID=56459 RepID=UPI00052D62DF|nr:hypothetical protein [Xanthomonas vasicola]KGR51223.1 hypothetical protein NX07_14415 [Xanthomonas vasicola]KGR57718.1 hypothetical protein NX09_02980 [Xanthomonas vasicola]KGT83138.1 hypothetical protein OC00_15365 [Xanthomonas vasicola]